MAKREQVYPRVLGHQLSRSYSYVTFFPASIRRTSLTQAVEKKGYAWTRRALQSSINFNKKYNMPKADLKNLESDLRWLESNFGTRTAKAKKAKRVPAKKPKTKAKRAPAKKKVGDKKLASRVVDGRK